MDKKIFVKPASGVLVPHPETGAHLPAEGAFIRPSKYFLRRIAEGSLFVTDPPATSPKTPSKKER